MIFWYTVCGLVSFQLYLFCKSYSNIKIVLPVSSERKAKDKRYVLEDQVVQTAEDSDCMIAFGEKKKKKGKIYLFGGFFDRRHYFSKNQIIT